MEKEQIVTKLTEVIHDVLPELDEVDMHANMVKRIWREFRIFDSPARSSRKQV